jgi:ParB family chromosome partitioning protein
LGQQIVRDKLSVREIEDLIKQKRPVSFTRKAKTKSGRSDIQLLAVEEELQRLWGTKVKIKNKGRGGILEVAFYSPNDLERILELLKGLR